MILDWTQNNIQQQSITKHWFIVHVVNIILWIYEYSEGIWFSNIFYQFRYAFFYSKLKREKNNCKEIEQISGNEKAVIEYI